MEDPGVRDGDVDARAEAGVGERGPHQEGLNRPAEDGTWAERERCVCRDGEGVRRGGPADALPLKSEGWCEPREATGAVVVVLRCFVEECM